MPAKDRPPSFQFYPKDYLSDSVVAAMTPEERGGYVHLLCHAFGQPEVGILPDDDEVLARLSDLRDRWPACRSAIRPAFRSASRSGVAVLIQKRMVEDRESQKNRYERAAEGARITNEARWGKVAVRPDSDPTASRIAVTPSSSSSFASSKEESKAKQLLPRSTSDALDSLGLQDPSPALIESRATRAVAEAERQLAAFNASLNPEANGHA